MISRSKRLPRSDVQPISFLLRTPDPSAQQKVRIVYPSKPARFASGTFISASVYSTEVRFGTYRTTRGGAHNRNFIYSVN
jgi:hypothetical protein